jgi:hypothetical protein
MPEVSRRERRKRPRLHLTRSLIARYGAQGAVIVDINEVGARIEHFAPLTLGRSATLVFEWLTTRIELEASVVACKVHRFVSGQHGGTVYQSGLTFTRVTEETARAMRDMMATSVARSVAEQVANLRGLGPVSERNMPVFRSGVVADDSVEAVLATKRKLPIARVHHGYLRCSLLYGRRWEKKWTQDPQQPDEGFTVLATEPRDLIDMLCDDYRRYDADTRRLIRLLASITVDEVE